MRRRRGIALADYVCGTMIFTASLLAFSTLTTSKFRLLDAAQARLMALGVVEARVDAIREGGLSGTPLGDVDADGYRKVTDFEPEPRLPEGWGRIDARALRTTAGGAHGLYEVRITVGWRDVNGTNQLYLSTVTGPPGEGR